MIPSFQYYFPNVIDGINQKHLNLTEYINKQQLIAKKSIWQDSLLSTIKPETAKPETTKTKTAKSETTKTETTKTKTAKTKTAKSETTKTQNESEMMIDDKYLGRIIGRGGIMINQIRTYSNTQITIYRELYNSSKRRIVIFGNQNCIQKAKNNILELCC
jgi:predicted RNA-binding protein YlqC (UPF0109 family)